MQRIIERHARRFVLTIGVAAIAAPASAQSDRAITKLADNVYEIRHRDDRDGFAGGNTTVIIGERQVVVVDASFLPSDAREDIAQIRKWTNKPVCFLVNTHFHNDHNLGNRVYMDSFPAITIVAHVETKKDMDLFGPGSLSREERTTAAYQQMLYRGTTPSGAKLTGSDSTQLNQLLARRAQVTEELKRLPFQSATLTFDHDFSIDVGNRIVQMKFLGRGNTSGDAVVFLPAERIVVTGDLVVFPMPYIYDGYPSEWIATMQRLADLDATTIVPGHGPVLHDKSYLYLLRDLMKSAVEQMNEALRTTGPAMFHTVDDVKDRVDLTPFRARFAHGDKELESAFEGAAANLVRVVFREASLR